MKPTLAAEELRASVTQYLTTTFALAEPDVRAALERFLEHPEQGIFRGPYLRIRTKFRQVDSGWSNPLDWAPAGFAPFTHQARAWERLCSKGKRPEPTLITTGTGSGKTESFLVPVLDHCRRKRADGHDGVKAVLLYPMNALATDQAQRINALLFAPGMEQVTAALYVGDIPEVGYPKVMTARAEIRRNPPDVLITNYKMLDLLLQRAEDVSLWRDARIAYAVVDEFHTYDGAQATDVAMLLRRLAAATCHVRPGEPLGDICPVAISATLGEGDATDGSVIRDVAENVFGVAFPPSAVIGENRLTVEEFVDELDFGLPLPTPDELISCGDPTRDPSALNALATAVTDREDLTASELGSYLRKHILTRAVLHALNSEAPNKQPLTLGETLELLPKTGAYTWGATIRDNPKRAASALARYIALLSTARDLEGRPLLHVETHLWTRAVTRLLRMVHEVPAFAWEGELPVLDADSMLTPAGAPLLPAVYCRHCGRSGWAALSLEQEPTELITDPKKIYRAAVGRDKRRVRPLIKATTREVEEGMGGLLVFDGARVVPHDPAKGQDATAVVVLADLATTSEANRRAEQDRCPACDTDHGIRFLGAGLASLASVVITQLLGSDHLPLAQRKTLLFNDSVQDAAHRAGFVASRAYAFSLRRLITSRLDRDTPVLLHDLIADLVAAATDADVLPSVVPPDLHDRRDIDAILAEETSGTNESWTLIGERLAFQTMLEFGLRSRQGRTLELTGTVAAGVVIDDAYQIAALAQDVHQQVSGHIEVQTPQRYLALVRGLLERMRYRGAIKHSWLDGWLNNVGTNRFKTIWGMRPEGMPAFPGDLSAPTFVIDRAKNRSEFDRLDADQGWLQFWTTRCLQLGKGQAGEFISRFLPLLATERVIASRVAADGATRIYGLQPGHVRVRYLDDEEVSSAGLGCDRCSWQQTVPPEQVDDWFGHPCPRYRCGGSLSVQGLLDRSDYYRHLYDGGGPIKVVTAEHTGALTRSQRELTEQRFRDGSRYNDPNVLSCTPTLELGIDIGDLSAVVLASLPPGPASYVQRVGRAGRRTGNALLVTLVGRTPRDLYFLDDPRQMIAGQIIPPGSFLSAVEILRRQYFAYLVDAAARGQLPGALPLPRLASALFGETGWLVSFVEAALAHPAAETFLGMFGARVNEQAAVDLRAFATSGITDAVCGAMAVWDERLAGLRVRLDLIDSAIESSHDDADNEIVKKSLVQERRAVSRRITEIGRTHAQSTLVELGLLPNYSLIDSATTLEATITWEESVDGDRHYHSEVREYRRSARLALTELAPGNTFYQRGYQHDITGLDIGSPTRQAWRHWRVCPDCGYVRTDEAVTDVTACPRCGSADIGEIGSLHRVLQPTKVTAHDRRDEARIRDDQDDRKRRYYEGAVAVDIDQADIAEGSWRHAGAVFGVDFTRRAVIRRFNLGTTRFDRPAADRFAGEVLRINPFHTCPACGGTVVDGPPAPSPNALVAPSIWDIGRRHHRPWCRYRRSAQDADYVKLILAHELRTEALRILLPVATLRVAERIATFQAALLLGVARKYGGSPDHLQVVTATMPDQETGRRRRFLVLHDALPGGTGYLHRLSSAEGFREVLIHAREAVATCRCNDDPNKTACHRCLLAYVEQDLYDKVSRTDALEMLDELLDNWRIGPVGTTDDISLWEQVESELEARFLSGIEAWARRADVPATLARGEVVDGRKTADLRIDTPDGGVHRWKILLQNTISGTRPDFVLRLVADVPQEVSVYLDGYEYHAAPHINRLADDARKRSRLRAHRGLVFSLTWHDMDDWEQRRFGPPSAKDPTQPPYGGDAQNVARNIYQRSGRAPAELTATMWTNPVDTLLAYLANPVPAVWLARAEAVVAGAVKEGTATTSSEISGATVRIEAALHGELLPIAEPGPIRVCAAGPLTIMLDERGAAPAWSALVVVDDRHDTIVADEDTHRVRWAKWLYWANLVQFLDFGAGDSAQLAYTGLAEFDATKLAACGGGGFLTMLSLAPLDPDLTDESLPPLPQRSVIAETVAALDMADLWRDIVDLLDPDEPGLAELALELAKLGVAAPIVGFELDEHGWQAELAWETAKVAVVLAGGDELYERDRAFAAAGWDARPVTGWTAGELTERIGGTR